MKRLFRVSLLVTAIVCSVLLGSSRVNAATKDMYRLYNPNSGEHFYTANPAERDNIKKAGWKDEGIGWYAPDSGDPVYRLYNANAGDHHYTVNSKERDHLKKVGWKYEGVGWYSDKKKTIPLYRAYNPNAKAGSHNYTVNKAEQNNLIRVGWKNEGIAWYGVTKGSPTTPSVKKTELQSLYNKVKGIAKGTYTDATWKTYQNALKNAKTILDNKKATQAQVNSAKDALQKAFNGLKKEATPTINTTALRSLYDKVKGTAKGTYTEASWKSFQSALTNAKNVLENKKATQAQINTAKDALQKAFDGLKKETPPEVQKYTITVKYVDSENKELQKSKTEQVTKGSNYTATAVDIEGYELQGEKTKKITNVTSNQEISFTYKKKDSGSGKEKVALTGYIHDASNQLVKNGEVKLSKENKEVETVTTDEEGYFFTHVTLGETYTLNGKQFEVTVTANALNDFTFNNIQGKLSLGKEFVNEDSEASLKPSVVYLDEDKASLETVREDLSQVSFQEELDIKKDDIIVTPPSERYPNGVALKIVTVQSDSNGTVVQTEQPKLEEVVQTLEGEASVGLDQATFIPDAGVSVIEAPQKKQAFGLEGNVDETLATKISLGRQIKNGSVEMDGFIDFGGKLDIAAAAGADLSGFYTKFDIKATLSQRVHGNISIKGSYDSNEDLRLGEIVVPTPVPMISVNIPVYLVVNVNGEATLKFDASVIETAGVKKAKDSNDIQVYPELTNMVQVPAPKFSFEGSFDARMGVKASVAANVLQMDIAKINGKTGLGYSCQAALSNEGESNQFNQKVLAFASVDAEVPLVNWKQAIFPQKEWTLWEKSIQEPKGEGTGKESGGETPGGEEPDNPSESEEGWLPLTATNFPDKYFREDIMYCYMGASSSDKADSNYAYDYVYDKEGNFLHYKINTTKLKMLAFSNSLTSDLTGINKFKNLEYFDVRNSMNLFNVDLRENLKLKRIDISNTSIQSMKTDNLKFLTYIYLNESPLKSININTNESLKQVSIHKTDLESLDVSGLKNLESLSCSSSKLSALNTDGANNIQYLDVDDNDLTQITVNHLVNLIHLSASKNKLTCLDLTNLQVLVMDTFHQTEFRENQLSEVYMPRNFASNFDDQWLINGTFQKNAPVLKVYYSDKLKRYDIDEYGSYILSQD